MDLCFRLIDQLHFQLDGGGVLAGGHAHDGLEPAGEIVHRGKTQYLADLGDVVILVAQQVFGPLDFHFGKLAHQPLPGLALEDIFQIGFAEREMGAQVLGADGLAEVLLDVYKRQVSIPLSDAGAPARPQTPRAAGLATLSA